MGKKLFDYVIGNPPYQEDTDGAGRQAKPVYNLFVDEAKKITRKKYFAHYSFKMVLRWNGARWF